MASNGTLKYSYKGKQYTKELPPPDQSKIDQYTQETLNAMTPEQRSSPDAGNVAKKVAEKRERAERVNTAKNEVLRANSAQLAIDEENNDLGISQRQKEPEVQPAAVTPVDRSTPPKEPNTDSDQLRRLPSFADKLNSLVYAYPKKGYVTKKIVPLGQGPFLTQVADLAFQASGHGHINNSLYNSFRNFDRFEKSLALKNIEHPGYTFITRPRLNLSDHNLIGDRLFYAMQTDFAADTAYGIRCLLDTRFAQTHNCPLVRKNNPFNALLFNGLRAINGFNDPFITTETTDGGYFQEDQTYAIGGDRMSRTYDLSLTFRDFAGGPISYMFDMWYKYIMNLQDGTMIQYADAIDANRLDYTVSIYRFILDRSRKTVTRWAKATGCFPVNSPTGVVFNKNAGESYVTNNDEFTITFKANRIEYNDPIIPHEFNMLVRRYNQELHSSAKSGVVGYAYEAQNNFNGIPYVRAGSYGHEMVFLRLSDDNAPIIKDTGKMQTTYNGETI